ncbi:hypothetical protein PoB_002314500 [Plakobranchus ocellatus]|uniref:Uncharacterized protein n=1 Tax=Plakobranchus ocellatus TaxID=259542 RepID=A0AAV3ZPW4_9GAST|nr:hypothetical protein PoB_002314500 [Plakobranchus ocellatus]
MAAVVHVLYIRLSTHRHLGSLSTDMTSNGELKLAEIRALLSPPQAWCYANESSTFLTLSPIGQPDFTFYYCTFHWISVFVRNPRRGAVSRKGGYSNFMVSC